MPSNAFSPSKLDIVNQVLGEIGRLPIDNIEDDQDAMLIALRLDVLLPELLLRTNWNWAIKYRSDNAPITVPFSPEYTYAFQLPADYGRMFRFYQQWYGYAIMDNLLLSNQRPTNYYYLVNTVDYDLLPPIFQRCLALYTASVMCMALTQNAALTTFITNLYMQKLSDAILQNDMDAEIIGVPNDFDRYLYV
jgi:hypothetical protein